MALRNVATITLSAKNGEEIFRHPPLLRIMERRNVSADAHGEPMKCAKRFPWSPHGQGEHVSPLHGHRVGSARRPRRSREGAILVTISVFSLWTLDFSFFAPPIPILRPTPP